MVVGHVLQHGYRGESVFEALGNAEPWIDCPLTGESLIVMISSGRRHGNMGSQMDVLHSRYATVYANLILDGGKNPPHNFAYARPPACSSIFMLASNPHTSNIFLGVISGGSLDRPVFFIVSIAVLMAR